jgi:PAS domain-containing protein
MEGGLIALGNALKALRSGVLMIVLGALLCLVGAFEQIGPVTINEMMSDKLYYAGLIMTLMGAFFSWYKGKMDALKLPSIDFYKADKIEREALMDQRFSLIAGEMADLNAKICDILYEVKPNGGGSMKDAVNRIGNSVDMLGSRYQVFIDSDAKPFFEANAQGHMLYVNRAYLAVVERGAAECVGNGWINTVVPSERSRVIHEWNASVTEQRAFECSYRILTPAGAAILVASRAQPILSDAGTTVGWLGQLNEAIAA